MVPMSQTVRMSAFENDFIAYSTARAHSEFATKGKSCFPAILSASAEPYIITAAAKKRWFLGVNPLRLQ